MAMSDRSEDEIAVSPAMVEKLAELLHGTSFHAFDEKHHELVDCPSRDWFMEQAKEGMLSLERIRRAEADAEVIRRSVLPS